MPMHGELLDATSSRKHDDVRRTARNVSGCSRRAKRKPRPTRLAKVCKLKTESGKLAAECWQLATGSGRQGHSAGRQDTSPAVRAELLHLGPDSSAASSFKPKQERARGSVR